MKKKNADIPDKKASGSVKGSVQESAAADNAKSGTQENAACADDFSEQEVPIRKQKIRKTYTKQKLWFFGILACLLLLAALFADQIAPYDPYAQDLSKALKPPSAGHPFGTDRHGRDMFSRVIAGSRTTIYAALAVVLITTVTGTVIGAVGGWLGGKTDVVLMRICDIFLAFPEMVFALAVAGVLGGGLSNAVIALSAVSWPKYARLARSRTLTVREMPYMAAAKMTGCSNLRILVRHLLPNLAGSMIVTATLDIGTMMMELAGLSFLGLGAQAPAAEWGSMMSNGRSLLQTSPWTILAPGCAIFVTVVIFNLLGDTLRDALDTRAND